MTTDVRHPILIVDDEPDVLFSLTGLLRREFELHTAESGEAALSILREHDIHVIMTDQRMPGMTGVELIGRARAEFPSAVRMIFTGYADVKAVVDALNSGGLFRYITKPWDPDDLIAALHEATQQYDRQLDLKRLATEVKAFAANADKVVSGAADAPDSTDLLEQSRSLAELASRLFPDS